jgi:hypothetical protein
MTERYEHPAFAVIDVARYSAGGRGFRLFGSELRHHSGITFTISRATLDRRLNHDYIHSSTRLIEFHMSEAQWATLVSSLNAGVNLPVTLKYAPKEPYSLEHMPEVAGDPLQAKFSREFQQEVERRVSDSKRVIQDLKDMVNDRGAVSKTRMRELVKELDSNIGGLPNTAKFVQDQFNEAMNDTLAAGKAEIEGFTRNLLTKHGIEALKVGALPNIDDGKTITPEEKLLSALFPRTKP